MKYIIASGPVIIENNNVLLNKHGTGPRDDKWKFIGGQIQDEETFEKCAIREAHEEMGVSVALLRPLKPMILYEKDAIVVLIHYLAKRLNKEIKPNKEIREWKWIPISDILNNKIADLNKNIRPIVEEAIKNL